MTQTELQARITALEDRVDHLFDRLVAVEQANYNVCAELAVLKRGKRMAQPRRGQQ